MKLVSKYYKEIRYLRCAIDRFSKYAWVIPLKDKKDITTVNAFQSILDTSRREPNKIWVHQGSQFYESSFKKKSKENHINIFNLQ